MSDSKTVSVSASSNVAALLGVLFVGLKLGHVISWPWIWVLLPFWGGLAIAVVILAVAALILGLVNLLEK